MAGETDYFRQALSDFAFDAACGGAVRHLAALGYTAKQIQAKLDFPVPYERVRKELWSCLTASGVILLEEPGRGSKKEKATYVREYDRYGKVSFRRVTEEAAAAPPILWRERYLAAGEQEELRGLLQRMQPETGYMSCDFGLLLYRSPEQFEKMLSVLEADRREYLEGLPWEKRRVYHRLDGRMRGILLRLFEAGLYEGSCYFPGPGEKIRLGGK